MHPNMVAETPELLTRYRIQPGTLILEWRQKADVLTTLMLRWQSSVRCAMPEFGWRWMISAWATQGCVSCSIWVSLPIDVLKIDKMFVEGLPEDSSMIAAIIMLAQSLNLQMIAEGVETEAQRDWLAKAGVGIAQGFLFARPLPIEIFEDKLPGKEVYPKLITKL